ncbi:F-box/LRR-repeat protein 5 [Manis javanica]|nr:F-box/LRR-repeat protein 5 [Manis javanica]
MPKDTLPRIVCCQVSRGPSSAPGRGSWKHTGPLSWPRADPGPEEEIRGASGSPAGQWRLSTQSPGASSPWPGPLSSSPSSLSAQAPWPPMS